VVELVADRVNEAGGVDGRQVSVVQGDTEATVDAGVSAAQALINVEGVDAVVGPTSLTLTGVLDLLRSNAVPTISPTAGTTELDDAGGDYVFRTVPSDSLGARAIAAALWNRRYNGRKQYERVALMVGNAPALQSFREPIHSAYTGLGGTVTATVEYRTGKTDYGAEVSRAMNSNPELVVLVGTPEDSVRILREAFREGYGGDWFVTQDQTTTEFLEERLLRDEVTDGMLGLTEADSPAAVESGRVEAFERAVADHTGSPPGQFAKNTFDAVSVLTLAMRAAAADGEVSRAATAAQIPRVARPPGAEATDYAGGAETVAGGGDVNYEGLVGPCDFDESGDIASPFSVRRATGDRWEEVAVLPADQL
jgi:neutral amino acid transport system substrate-binding protein